MANTFITFEELPMNAKKVESLAELVSNKAYWKVGQKYLLWSDEQQCYQLYTLSPFTEQSYIEPFINLGLMWLLVETKQSSMPL